MRLSLRNTLALVSMLLMLGTAWVSIRVDVTKLQQEVIALKMDMQELKTIQSSWTSALMAEIRRGQR
jgi:hypothetical protein